MADSLCHRSFFSRLQGQYAEYVTTQNQSSPVREAIFHRETNEGYCNKLLPGAKYVCQGQGHVGHQIELVVAFDLSAVTYVATVYLGAVAE